jgi:L-threonylcarbamoyladenylate synthase
VQAQLGARIPYILDGGPCRVGIESTIIGFHNGQGIVLRTGGLKIEAIEGIIGNVRIQVNKSSNPIAPGQLDSHYAPRKKLLVGNIEELIAQDPSANSGILSFRNDYRRPAQVILSPSGSLEEAARNFFAGLRKLDEANIDIILAEYVPDQGLGKAINDRLKRATYRG